MPERDKTGPNGSGPKTGRQLGNCEGATPTVGQGFCYGMRRGFGRGCGRGRGFGRNFTLTKEQEKQILEAEKKRNRS